MPAYGKVKVDTITYDLSGTATDVSVANIATKASPTFTGTVTVPTPTAGDNSTKAASTAFVAASFAPLASPTFTGSPTVPGYAALSGATFTGTVNGTSLVLSADLTVNGTTTTINTTTLQVEDKNIEIGKVSTPSDTTADGGGLTLLGATNKTWNWVNSTDAWTSSEHIQVASGKTFIGDGSTLTALNASNISSGTIAAARVPTLNQNTTGNAATATALATARTIGGTSFDGTANITVDAATLDGIDSGSFVRSDASDTLSGATYTISSTTNQKLILSGSTSPYLRFQTGTTNKAYIEWNNGNGCIGIGNEGDSSQLRIKDNIDFTQDGSTFHKVWHAGNDGTGSGLDADTVDGIEGASIARSDIEETITGKFQFTSSGSYPLKINGSDDSKILLKGSSNPLIRFQEASTDKALVGWNSSGFLRLTNNEDASELRIRDNIEFAVDGTNFYSVIHQNNVGSGGALSSTNVYVNQIHGDGSNLTNLPGGGLTVDLVADGDIAAGKPVIIKDNGKAEKVKMVFTNHDPDQWGETRTLENNQIYYPATAYDKTANVYIAHYGSSSGSKMCVRAGQVYLTGGWVSFGTEVEYQSYSGLTGLGICSLGAGTKKFLITYNAGSDFKARVVEVSGANSNVCTVNSDVTFDNGGGTINPQAMAFDPDTNRAVCVYRVANDGTNQHRGYACVFSVSGTTVSAGTPVLIENGYNNDLHTCCYDEHTNRLVIAYAKMSNYSGYIRLATIDSSSNTLTIHGASSSFEGQIDQGLVLATNNIGQVCVGYNKATGGYNNGRVAATLFTIDASNNTVSFGSYGLFSNDADGHSRSLSITYNAGGDTFVITWGDTGENNRLNANLREYSGTTWGTGYDQERIDNSNSALQTSVLAIDESEASCIVLMALGTVKGQMHTFRTASGTDNISGDSVNFLGFAEAAISDGNTGTIILGGVVENQTGLTPGTGYLVTGVGGLEAGSFNGGPGLLAIASDKGVIRNGVG